MIFVEAPAFSQSYLHKPLQDIDLFNTKLNYQPKLHTFKQVVFKTHPVKEEESEKINSTAGNFFNQHPYSIIHADFYTQNFGFFCRKELQFEKTTNIPLRFRLGSLQYNNYLEGKPNAVKPN